MHNERTYPHLLRLFAELDVATQPAEMSMSVSCRGCGLEYAGALGLSGLFPSPRNLTRGRYLRLLADVPRFHRQARALLAAATEEVETLDAFLDRGRFSRYFRTHFVTPLVACVWSCGPDVAGQYPARYLFEFLRNHGMLTVTGSPQWRTVTGGSARYVERAAKNLSAVQTQTPVRAVTRVPDGVEVRDDADQVSSYDAVVLATHPDQALSLLADPTADERSVLGAFDYSVNPTLLHDDTRVLPRSPRARASWNYLMRGCDSTSSSVEVSYDLNRLQRLATDDPFLVTLNDPGTIPAGNVIERMTYRHPTFTPASVAAQRRLPDLNDGVLGVRRRLPRVGLPRGRLPLRRTRRREPGGHMVTLPAMYDVEIVHRRREPVDHTVRHRMTTWLVDLAEACRARGSCASTRQTISTSASSSPGPGSARRGS